jgi:hypothetical protein
MAASFVPRTAFPAQLSLPRSYFLGHHAAGLSTMKTMLSSIDLIIECRDYRVPLTSRNPLFEQSLAGRERLVVYTKRDLGSRGRSMDRMVSRRTDYPQFLLANCPRSGRISFGLGTVLLPFSFPTTNRSAMSNLSLTLRKTMRFEERL